MNQQQKMFQIWKWNHIKNTHLAWAKGVRAFCLSGVCYRYWACWQGGAFIPHCYQSVIWVSTFCSLTQHTGFRCEILFWEMESCTWKQLWIFRVTKGDETGLHSVFKSWCRHWGEQYRCGLELWQQQQEVIIAVVWICTLRFGPTWQQRLWHTVSNLSNCLDEILWRLITQSFSLWFTTFLHFLQHQRNPVIAVEISRNCWQQIQCTAHLPKMWHKT